MTGSELIQMLVTRKTVHTNVSRTRWPQHTCRHDFFSRGTIKVQARSLSTTLPIMRIAPFFAISCVAAIGVQWVATFSRQNKFDPNSNSLFALSTFRTRILLCLRTRLTIVANSPEGFEFTIRTPGTPARWSQYEDELCAVWGKLTAAVCGSAPSDSHSGGHGETPTGAEEEAREDTVCDLILTMFYYWVNFGPLSRGSAACGYIVLSGLMAAAGWRLTELLPPNVQMDWEAILRPSPEAFIAKARPWLRRTRRREDILEDVPAVQDAFPTALEAIKALNGP